MTASGFALLLTALGLAAGVLLLRAVRHMMTHAKLSARVQAVELAGVARLRPPPAGRSPGEGGDILLRRKNGGFPGWLKVRWGGFDALYAWFTVAGVGRNFMQFLLVLVTAALVLTALLTFLTGNPGLSFLLAVVICSLSMRLIGNSRLAQRRRQFLLLLPDALGLMVRGLRAGAPIGRCVEEVGRELADPVGEIFRRAQDQVRLGQPLEKALAAETRALDIKPMAFLLVTLSVQRETGGNLVESLEKLVHVLNRREQMELKIRALSSEARASAAIIGSLPLVMAALMWITTPDYIAPLFTTGAGRVMLGGAALSLTVGVLLMVWMVRFEFR
ncbi:MAG: type II secretion system F family protein [Sphingomonadaceae bacterium]